MQETMNELDVVLMDKAQIKELLDRPWTLLHWRHFLQLALKVRLTDSLAILRTFKMANWPTDRAILDQELEPLGYQVRYTPKIGIPRISRRKP